MTSRQLPQIKDVMSDGPQRLLRITLADFFPQSVNSSARINKLCPGYNLVYFPSPTKLSSLLPDGTDPLHSPGPPFTRRMWAGGSMKFLLPIKTDLRPFLLFEKIVDVQVKGREDAEKVFVTIERAIKPRSEPRERDLDMKTHILETRNIVFLREKLRESSTNAESPSKSLRPTTSPDVIHKVVPTAALLFRFSALTFNSHAIHLDKKYCQEIEGYRNLLVHGPLSLMLMLETLRHYLYKLKDLRNDGNYEIIEHIEYRNLAPLSAEEELQICIKRKGEDSLSQTGSFEVWIQGLDGGYAVKGTVKTRITPLSRTVTQAKAENR